MSKIVVYTFFVILRFPQNMYIRQIKEKVKKKIKTGYKEILLQNVNCNYCTNGKNVISLFSSHL